MDITICTSCWNYGQYVEQWAEGILSQKVLPKAVSFFNNASTDDTKEQWERAKKKLEAKGVETIYTESEEKIPFGVARNRSIAPAKTEWVCHFDVDDQMLPNFISDSKPLSGSADVIAVGYKTFGDENGRVNIYGANRTNEQILSTPKVCSPVAPFRKTLWEQNPYEERMKSSWDTVLWLKFAHAGARFTATKSYGYLYRVHRDSIFQKKKRNPLENLRNAMDIETFRRKLDPMVTCIIPHREIDEHRKRNFEKVIGRIRANNPLWEILSGDSEGEWNKAKVVNRLAREANGTILVVMDNDVIPTDQGLYTALSKVVYHGEKWAIPHGTVHRMSEKWKEGDEPDFDRAPYTGVEGGGCFIIGRDSYFMAGGMDEGFSGWGGEDLCFGFVCRGIYGPPYRHNDPLLHLWHPPQETRSGGFGRNSALGLKYQKGKNNLYVMHRLAEQNRKKNFPDMELGEIRCYLCSDIGHLKRMEMKFPDPPEFIEVETDNHVNKIGVIKTCVDKKIMLRLPCVKQIPEDDFNLILKRTIQ